MSLVQPQVRDSQDLISIFADLFAHTEQTRLVRGEAEPVYLPLGPDCAFHRVVFAHGFFASALHEVAHWCVAGRARRAQADYGYWYKPDGRTATEQAAFEAVEVRPQALEWIFAVAAGTVFHFSADNLLGDSEAGAVASRRFQVSVSEQAQAYIRQGLPARAARFATALSLRYETGAAWCDPGSYRLD